MKNISIILSVLLLFTGCSSVSESSSVDTSDQSATSAADTSSSVTETDDVATISTFTEISENNLSVSIDEQVLFDEAGVKITASSLEQSNIKLFIENNSEKNINVSCDSIVIDNIINDIFFSENVAASKKSNSNLSIPESIFSKVELKFHIFDSDTYETILDSELIPLQINGASEPVVTSVSGTVLMNQDGIKVTGINIEDNQVKLLIENSSDKDVGVSIENVSIDGFMVNTLSSATVYAGKSKFSKIEFLKSELEQNNITSIKGVEFTIHVFDAESYDTLFDSESVRFKN